jgi:murein DD-endopeptidase / murein LD-carboxypeptidase
MIRQIILTCLVLSGTMGAAAQKTGKQATPAQVRFIDDIQFTPGQAPVLRQAQDDKAPLYTSSKNNALPATLPISVPGITIEEATALHIKYALLLDTEVEQVGNTPLFQLIDEWWGTRYRLGGADRNGIDCSGFTQVLYNQLYRVPLPRISRDQFRAATPVPVTEMQEGDLVFFAQGSTITHVGFYLHNNKFVHASTSEGVMISDLNEPYWSKRFAGAGRFSKEPVVVPATIKP